MLSPYVLDIIQYIYIYLYLYILNITHLREKKKTIISKCFIVFPVDPQPIHYVLNITYYVFYVTQYVLDITQYGSRRLTLHRT